MENILYKLGMKGDPRRPFIIVVIALFLMAGALTMSSAERNGPVPDPGGDYLTPYDWIIESGDDILWEDTTILVNGNLTVGSGGKLTLNQVDLRMNCTVDGLLTFEVEDGGELIVENCLITSSSATKHFKMVLDGSVTMESVAISEVYGDYTNPWDHGIELHSSDIRIMNSSFTACQGDVIHVESSSPTISGNRFYDNLGAAIYINGTSSPRIVDNHVYRQRFGIVSGFYSSPIIDGNTIFEIENNGILLNGYRIPLVSNNTIYQCLNGMLLWYSNARLENNLIHNNEAGYNIKVDSKPVISNDLIRDNEYVGISVNDSIVEVRDSVVRDHTYDGIRSFNGSRVKVIDTVVQNNGDDGFQVTNAHLETHGATVLGNNGDAFYLRDSAVMDIFDTQISGGDPPMGSFQIDLDSGSTATLYDTEFNSGSVSFGNDRSRLIVKKNFAFKVMDITDVPIPDVYIDIRDESGLKRPVGTDENGEGSRYLTLYEQKDLNGDFDGKDPGERSDHIYNYSIVEPGFFPYHEDLDNSEDDIIEIHLIRLPMVRVIDSYPNDGDVGVPVDTSIHLFFDKDIDPSTIGLDVSGPGGMAVIFDSTYYPSDFLLEIVPMNDLGNSMTFTVILEEAMGASGEILENSFYFTFRTVASLEPDNDEDGVPDTEDDDDDNDGYDDIQEEFYGTDPKDPTDYPLDIPDDDDDDIDPGTEPDPPDPSDDDDDDDSGIVIIPSPPSSDDDDDTTHSPYVPVDTSDEMPKETDDGLNYLILIVSSVIGLLILVGVMTLIFFKSGGGQRLTEVESGQRPPTGG